jgi:mevalonate kinase
VIQAVQGRGSGADAAASIYGGIVRYAIGDAATRSLSRAAFPITAVYSGYKKPTAEVIARVSDIWSGRAGELHAIFEQVGKTVDAGEQAIDDGDREAFGRALEEGQDLMRRLGVSTPELEQCVALLRSDPGIAGAKISGSGLGDCAIGWGRTNKAFAPFDTYAIVTAQDGLRIE